MRARRMAVLLAAGVALAVWAARAQAPAPSDHLVPMDLFNLQYAADPQISPDGTRIVYERHFADVFADHWRSNLWIVNVDGSDNRPLTTGNFSDTAPRWSPDGRRLAFISDRDGKPQLYVRWMDTGQTARLTDLPFPPADPAWSPDGRLIAFTEFVPGKPPALAELPHPPAGASWAEGPQIIDRLVYRFNGRGYLPAGTTQIFVVGAEGGGPRQVSHGDYNFGGGFFGTALNWTPDGTHLIFSANLRRDAEYDPQNTEVYELSVADGSWKALTDRRGPDNAPALSPDGRLIAYTGFDDRYQGHQTTHLYVMNRDGSGSHVVAADLDRDVQRPQWTPDGRSILFIYDDQGDTKLGLATLDGQHRVVAEHLGSNNTSYSAGASFSVARNGRFATVVTTATLPGSVATGTLEGTGTRIVANPNSTFLAGKKLATVEEFWYTSSYDQRRIQGWILKPPDFQPGKKYPMILEIHGGPFANYGNRFDIEKQLMAAAGYVVVYVNPRGSTSYGEEFANLIHHAYPGHDFEDLNSGVDAVISRGYVDPERLYVTGGSGGGVLTCWVVDHTDRFKAAASLYPVVNWVSWTLTADIPITGVRYWFPGPPWEYMDQYMQRSVLSLVGHVKTPTLLMTGTEDYRTPITEAEQFYEALKLRKVDAVLVRVPGEPHGLSRRPSHQMTKVLEILAWFEKHP